MMLMLLSLLLVATALVDTDAETNTSASVVPCDPCIDRSQVKIGCVHHGIPSQDVFWQLMDSAIAQGAQDMGIDLRYEPIADLTLDPGDESSVEDYMSDRIRNLCSGEDKVSGIFVSLPSPNIVDALNVCREAGIPAIVFNAGFDTAEANGYQFIGQNEYQAGLEAGKGLGKAVVESGQDGTSTFCCINHAPGVGVLTNRCGGFEDGLAGALETVLVYRYTDVHVDPNDCSSFDDAILTNCSPAANENGDWSSVGLYFAGKANHACGVKFLQNYPLAYSVASDVSQDLYLGMNEGLRIVFGIDQQTYLQGYLPSSFLTLASTNDQIVQNDNIETGPKLITETPSDHYQQCKANGYAVCDADGGGAETSASSSLRILPLFTVFNKMSFCILAIISNWLL